MRLSINKLLVTFTVSAIFVSVLMVCCINFSDDETITESADTAVTSAKEHVFHSGDLCGIWVPYFSLCTGDNMSELDFKSHFDEIIEKSKKHGINTIFVQVRPNCDSAYPSKIFPFMPMFGDSCDYDPLEYMIEKSHQAGLEFHAWINPYRISAVSTDIPSNSPCADWIGDTSKIVEVDGGLFMNPGSREVRSLIIDGVQELAQNYNIDGVHMDDYFYAFSNSDFDSTGYNEYVKSLKGKKPLTLEKWRCANVNVLVSGLHATVKQIDPDMLFGISPQANTENDISMGADVYTWCSQKGYVDYIAPQVYFSSENPICPYESCVDKWHNMITSPNVDYYVGLALYKIGTDEDGGAWQNPDIFSYQRDYALSHGANGYILYSYDYLFNAE